MGRDDMVTNACRSVLPNAVELSRRYDVERMRQDLADFPARSGASFSAAKGRRSLPLRSVDGDPSDKGLGGPGVAGFRDTPWLRHLPYFQEILAGFPAPVGAARLCAVGPGRTDMGMREAKMGPAWGFCRLHLPVTAGEGASTVFVGDHFFWPAGTLWFAAAWREYALVNRSPSELVHLIVDLLHTQALSELFPPSARAILNGPHSLRLRPPVVFRHPATFRSRFRVPEAFADWEIPAHLLYAEAQRTHAAARRAFIPAEVRVSAGIPLLHLGGRPFCSLEHVGGGEFRLRDWSDERTLRLTEQPDAPALLRLREGSKTYQIRLPADTTSTGAVALDE